MSAIANRYATTCQHCERTIRPYRGTVERNPAGKWVGTCCVCRAEAVQLRHLTDVDTQWEDRCAEITAARW